MEESSIEESSEVDNSADEFENVACANYMFYGIDGTPLASSSVEYNSDREVYTISVIVYDPDSEMNAAMLNGYIYEKRTDGRYSASVVNDFTLNSSELIISFEDNDGMYIEVSEAGDNEVQSAEGYYEWTSPID